MADENSTFYLHRLLPFEGLPHTQNNCYRSSSQMVESLVLYKQDFGLLCPQGHILCSPHDSSTRWVGQMLLSLFYRWEQGDWEGRDCGEVTGLVSTGMELKSLHRLPCAPSFSPCPFLVIIYVLLHLSHIVLMCLCSYMCVFSDATPDLSQKPRSDVCIFWMCAVYLISMRCVPALV